MSRRRLIAVVVVAMAAVFGGGWWFTHPDAIEPPGSISSAEHPGVNRTQYFGLIVSPKRPVRVVSVTPRVSPSGDADVDILACKHPPGTSRIGSGATIEDCEDVRSAAGAVISQESGGWYLIARVIPTTENRTVIRGVDLSYRDGWRLGHYEGGNTVIVRAAKDQ